MTVDPLMPKMWGNVLLNLSKWAQSSRRLIRPREVKGLVTLGIEFAERNRHIVFLSVLKQNFFLSLIQKTNRKTFTFLPNKICETEVSICRQRRKLCIIQCHHILIAKWFGSSFFLPSSPLIRVQIPSGICSSSVCNLGSSISPCLVDIVVTENTFFAQVTDRNAINNLEVFMLFSCWEQRTT